MSNFFNMDNAFFTTIGKLVDLFLISLIWVLLCLPVITAGPATTALYYTVVKVIRRERGYLVREFFNSFKVNFKQGAVAGVIVLLLSFALYYDRKIVAVLEGNFGFVMFTLVNATSLILFCVSIYIFPVLSRFKMSLMQLLKSSLFMAMKHLPTTLLLAVIVIAFAVGVYVMPIVICLAPALCCLVCSFFLERVFKKYMPEKSGDEENTTTDEWYLE